MTIYKPMYDIDRNYIVLPSGHFCYYQLVPKTLSNKVDFIILKTDIPKLLEMRRLHQCYCLDEPEDSIILEGTKIVFN